MKNSNTQKMRIKNLLRYSKKLGDKEIIPFKIDKSYWNYLNIETLKFLIDEARYTLIDYDNASKLILTKSTSIFQICIAATFALIGFLATTSEKIEKLLMILSFVNLISLFIVCLFLFVNIKPKSVAALGSEPIDLVKNHLKNEEANTNEKSILIRVLSGMQNDIYKNKMALNKKVLRFNNAIKIIYADIIICLIILSINYFCHLFQ